MALNWAKSGINHVPSYQISGIPFVTASVNQELTSDSTSVKVSFPYVTSWVVIQCTGSAGAPGEASLKFGFSDLGVTNTASPGSKNRYFVLNDGSRTERLELRCKEIYLARSGSTNAGFNILAGLTTIEAGHMLSLTGSSEFAGIG
jgi:hypothetical protein